MATLHSVEAGGDDAVLDGDGAPIDVVFQSKALRAELRDVPGPGAGGDIEHYDAIVVGAGLSGAVAAWQLTSGGGGLSNVAIVEARPRVGGRLYSSQGMKWLSSTAAFALDAAGVARPSGGTADDAGGAGGEGDAQDGVGDLGGAWIWPGQTAIQSVVESVGVETVVQEGPYGDGRMRVVGGALSIVDGLLRECGSAITLITGDAVTDVVGGSTVITASGRRADALAGVIVALPPRLTGQIIEFEPELPPRAAAALAACTTWMAAATKVAVHAPRRLWAEGAAAGSDLLPTEADALVEVYDSGPGAVLVGFAFPGTLERAKAKLKAEAETRGTEEPSTNPGADSADAGAAPAVTAELLPAGEEHSHAAVVVEQLARGLGAEAAKEIAEGGMFESLDWSTEVYTSGSDGAAAMGGHPRPGRRELREPLLFNEAKHKGRYRGVLVFAGSETDDDSPGLMEGAVRAGARAAEQLLANASDAHDISEQPRRLPSRRPQARWWR